MNHSRGPRRMGAPLPNRFQRGGQSVNNYHHQQLPQHQHRPMNNIPWQQPIPNMSNIPNVPNMSNYHMNQGDNPMLSYQQHMDNYGNFVPTMQSLNMPSMEMINPNNQHVFQQYLPQNFIPPQMIHGPISPVENVMISQPINIATPPPPPSQAPMRNSSPVPMNNSPTNSLTMVNQMPVLKKPFDKFNSRENLVRCAKCNHENHLVACEFLNKDEEIARLNTQIVHLTQLANDLKYQLQQERLGHSQSTVRILQTQPSHNITSHLSPEAPEFKPDDHSAAFYNPPTLNEVPVVSANVMNEEAGSEVHVELDEQNNEDGLKAESEDLHEEIAPNETPPEEKASFNDDPPEVLEQPLDVEVTEEQNTNIGGNASDAADESATADVVTEVPQEQNVPEELVEESEVEELVAHTDSSSQVPEPTDDDNNSSDENQLPISVNEPERSAEESSNSRPAYQNQSYPDHQRGNNRNSRMGENRKADQGYPGSGYMRGGGRGQTRNRNDSFGSDKSRYNIQSHRNQNQQMPRYQNNFRQNKYGDDSQEKKPRDSYSDSLSKERNGQPDNRGGKYWESRGNSNKIAHNNQPLLNWGEEFKTPQGRPNEDSDPRDRLTELKTKNNSGYARANERRPHYKQYIISELKGDVFSAPEEFSLGHCVAKDFRMGSGIAVKFKSEFKRVAELLDQNVDVGGCAHLKHNDRYIFYLVTKDVSCGKPTMATMRQSLEALKEKCQRFGVNKLAIPHIGCGLDKLIWPQVRSLIIEVFSETGITINAYEFNASPHFYKNKKNRWMQKGSFSQRIDSSEHSEWFGNDLSNYDCLPLLFNEDKDHKYLSQSIGVEGKNLHDRGKSFCFKISKKERKVDDPNYYEQFRQQELPVHIKSDKTHKTKVNKSKVDFSHILDKSDDECQNMNQEKEETKSKRKSGSKSLIDTISNSFENKKALKKCKKRASSSQKIQSKTEASDDQDAKGKISHEYTDQSKKSKKKSKKEIKKKHGSHSKSTIQKVHSQVEEETETANKSATNSFGLTCTVMDNYRFVSNNHKKKKRKHNDTENNSETPLASNIHKKRKRKLSEAVIDDKTPFPSKKRKHKHSEDEKGNENNPNVEEDVSISFSKHNKKKKTHRKSHTL